MKYCRITGASGIGKSTVIKNTPLPRNTQIIDTLKRKNVIDDETNFLVIDHADSNPEKTLNIINSAEVDWLLLIGQKPNDSFWTKVTNSWHFDASFKGGFNDLAIEVSLKGKKMIYETSDLPQKLADIDLFFKKIILNNNGS